MLQAHKDLGLLLPRTRGLRLNLLISQEIPSMTLLLPIVCLSLTFISITVG